MRKRIYVIMILAFICVNACGCSNKKGKDEKSTLTDKKIITEDLSSYFDGYDGCFILYNTNEDEYIIYNEEKTNKQVPPCSSFKIYNSLIALDSKAIQDENDVIEWDGTETTIAAWNKDQTLASAISNSVVWAFQVLASRVGEEKMQNYLDDINYGNKDISGGITTFWLQSSLKISPMEQMDLLKKFYNKDLPFTEEHINIVKEAIMLSDVKDIILSGKTGSGTNTDKSKYINGWFIGYVEKADNVYYFVTNIESIGTDGKPADGSLAKSITLKILEDKQIVSN